MDEHDEKERRLGVEHVIIGDTASRLSGAIFFLVCLVPIVSTILFGGVDNTTWILITVFWVLIILLWLAEAWKGGGLLINPAALQIPLLGLVVVGLLQIIPLGGGSGGELPAAAISNTISFDPYATRFFITRLIVYLVFFAACLTYINHERRLKKAVLMIIIFGSGMAFFGILQRLGNPEGIYGLRETPQAIPFGSFVNQHHFAAFMEMTAGVTLGVLFGKTLGNEKRVLLASAAVVMGVAAVFTGSRGGMLGLVAVLLFVTLFNIISGRWSKSGSSKIDRAAGIRSKIVLGAAAVAILLVIGGVALFLGGNDSLLRGVGVVNPEADISTGRFHFWPIAIRIFLEHPVLGVGFDAFAIAFTKHDTWSGAFRIEQAHNDYLQTLADAGMAGFVCIAGFIFLLFRNSLNAIATAGGSFRRNAAVGALAGCFGILVHSFFDFPLRTPSNAFFFLLLCAVATVSIASGHSRVSRRRKVTEP